MDENKTAEPTKIAERLKKVQQNASELKKKARRRRWRLWVINQRLKEKEALLNRIRHNLYRVWYTDHDWKVRSPKRDDFLDWLLKKMPPTEQELKLKEVPHRERTPAKLGAALYRLWTRLFPPEKEKKETE